MSETITVAELAQRNPANLAAKVKEVNEARKLSGNTPSEKQLGEWRKGKREGWPPYLAVIALLVLAADHQDGDFDSNAYWERLHTLRRDHRSAGRTARNRDRAR